MRGEFVLGVVAGRLLFGDVSTPALQARFAGGGEQFVFVQDAQGDVVDGVEVGGVAVPSKAALAAAIVAKSRRIWCSISACPPMTMMISSRQMALP